MSLACTHSNTNSGNSRWIVGSPLNCAETVSSSVTPGQSCEPYVSFQDDSMLSEGVVSSIATVATDNTSVNGTVLECRDGAGLLYTSVGNVAICVVGKSHYVSFSSFLIHSFISLSLSLSLSFRKSILLSHSLPLYSLSFKVFCILHRFCTAANAESSVCCPY